MACVKLDWMKRKLKLAKKGLVILISVVGTVLFLWLVLLSKVRLGQTLASFFAKAPKSSVDLMDIGKNVLGTAEEVATSKNAQKILESGANFFETSTLIEPVKILRENLVQKVAETIETIRELPEKEVRTIKREVCKQWLEGE